MPLEKLRIFLIECDLGCLGGGEVEAGAGIGFVCFIKLIYLFNSVEGVVGQDEEGDVVGELGKWTGGLR